MDTPVDGRLLDMPIEVVEITKLHPHPDNPRKGNVGAIVTSIKTNGWYGTLVAQTSTGRVLAGNHRLQAAAQLGMTEVPVYWVDVDDQTARRILFADNRSNDLATYDDELLRPLLTDLVRDATQQRQPCSSPTRPEATGKKAVRP